jgi:hypothetical protein
LRNRVQLDQKNSSASSHTTLLASYPEDPISTMLELDELWSFGWWCCLNRSVAIPPVSKVLDGEIGKPCCHLGNISMEAYTKIGEDLTSTSVRI